MSSFKKIPEVEETRHMDSWSWRQREREWGSLGTQGTEWGRKGRQNKNRIADPGIPAECGLCPPLPMLQQVVMSISAAAAAHQEGLLSTASRVCGLRTPPQVCACTNLHAETPCGGVGGPGGNRMQVVWAL